MSSLPSPPARLCRSCGVAQVVGVGFCVRCGMAQAHSEHPPLLVVRSGPMDAAQRRRAVGFLSRLGEGLEPEEVDRLLARLPAVLRAPVTDGAVERIVEGLRAHGYEAEIQRAGSEHLEREYLESLWAKKSRLAPYALLIGAGLAIGATGAGLLATLVMLGVLPWWHHDRRSFLARITLHPALVGSRIGMVPDAAVAPIAALLRRELSEPLRQSLSAVLVEAAQLFETFHALVREFPEVVTPLKQRVQALVLHAAELADKAAAIESAGDFHDARLSERLAKLRSRRATQEIERRALQLELAQEERKERLEQLRELHATLLVRLETLGDSLRSLRQRALEVRVAESAGGDALDRLVTAVREEEQVVQHTVTEMARLERNLTLG